MRFIHEEFAGVQAISALLAAARGPARLSFLVVRCGLKLSHYADIRIVRLMPTSRLCRHPVRVRSEALAVAAARVVSGPARSA